MNRKIVKKVFVVDDSEFESSLLRDYLVEHTMHNVQVFGTGEECISRLVDEPDVIVLDYNLNSIKANAANGSEILASIKKIAPSIHVIMLSGQDAYGIAIQTVMHGADSYVIKDNDAFAKIAALIHELN